tara:strand:- start:893 stop:1870 length:978 start_codon:yes stop_codon:yes gene_type:complete
MSRLFICFLLLVALILLYILSRTTEIEGLSTQSTSSVESIDEKADSIEIANEIQQKNIKILKKQIITREKKEDPNDPTPGSKIIGSHSLNDKAAILHEMSPSYISDRLAESAFKYRWIKEDWPNCDEPCSSLPISRNITCFKRNEKQYSDDLPMSALYDIPANEKDKFGRTECDNARSGININVKPAEQSFCSLINSCSKHDLHNFASIPFQKSIQQMHSGNNKYIGFSKVELDMIGTITPEQKSFISNAFDQIHTVSLTNPLNPEEINKSDFLFTDYGKLQLYIKSLDANDQQKIYSILKQVKLITRTENYMDAGNILIMKEHV